MLDTPCNKQFNTLCERIMGELKDNPTYYSLALSRKGDKPEIVIYVIPEAKDRENFDPEKYGLKTEYYGEKVRYQVLLKEGIPMDK